MKTINEVIAEMSDCIEHDQDCSECKSFVSCAGRPWRAFDKDALQYLKMYKELAADSEAFAEWKESQKENVPLTWNQIKEMDRKGRPIWFEWAEEDQVWKYWCFVSRWKGKQKQILEVMDSEGDYHEFYQEMIGTDWNAFRKENAWK